MTNAKCMKDPEWRLQTIDRDLDTFLSSRPDEGMTNRPLSTAGISSQSQEKQRIADCQYEHTRILALIVLPPSRLSLFPTPSLMLQIFLCIFLSHSFCPQVNRGGSRLAAARIGGKDCDVEGVDSQ